MELMLQKVNSTVLRAVETIKQLVNQLQTQASSCIICGQRCKKIPSLCEHCQQLLPQFNLEQTENNLLNWPAIYNGITPTVIDSLICVSPYLWPFNQWINALKYEGRFDLAPMLSALLVEQLNKYSVQVNPQQTGIIPVPIHIKKWQSRGYNQALLLAKPLAKKLQLPLISSAIYKNEFHQAQAGLSGKQRRANLSNSFSLNDASKLTEHVLLVDDVVTTGSTVNEIAQLLKQSGVKTVTVLAICLSLPA